MRRPQMTTARLRMAGQHLPAPDVPPPRRRKGLRRMACAAVPGEGRKAADLPNGPWSEIEAEARGLLAMPLAPEQRRRLQAVLDATDPGLTLAEVARRNQVSRATLHKWWSMARTEGLQVLLDMRSRRAPALRTGSPPGIGPTEAGTKSSPGLESITGLTLAQCSLLRAAGVKTSGVLATHDPAKLQRWIAEVNEHERFCLTPDMATVEGWIEQARQPGMT